MNEMIEDAKRCYDKSAHLKTLERSFPLNQLLTYCSPQITEWALENHLSPAPNYILFATVEPDAPNAQTKPIFVKYIHDDQLDLDEHIQLVLDNFTRRQFVAKSHQRFK